MFAGNFAPAGWMFCNGQLLPISENEILFQAIGTTYGGDGQETFALPDLQSRVPLHMGTGTSGTTYTIGETGGVEEVTLSTNQIPSHTHVFLATGNQASSTAPANLLPGITQASTITPYGSDAPIVALSPSSISPAGGGQPHTNLQPFLAISFIISLFGLFPSQT